MLVSFSIQLVNKDFRHVLACSLSWLLHSEISPPPRLSTHSKFVFANKPSDAYLWIYGISESSCQSCLSSFKFENQVKSNFTHSKFKLKTFSASLVNYYNKFYIFFTGCYKFYKIMNMIHLTETIDKIS